MIAESIALRPVIHVHLQPELENVQIARIKGSPQPVRPIEGYEGLLASVRPEEILAEGEYPFLVLPVQGPEIPRRDLSYNGRIHPVTGDFFFEKPLETIPCPFIGPTSQLVPYRGHGVRRHRLTSLCAHPIRYRIGG